MGALGEVWVEVGVGGKNKGGMGWGRGGVKMLFLHPNELFIWAYPEKLVKIGLAQLNQDLCQHACKPHIWQDLTKIEKCKWPGVF